MVKFYSFLLVVLFLSCKDLFLYNPNEVTLNEDEKNLNEKNIQKIKALPSLDTFKFVVFGDAQRFYDEVEDLVSVVNGLENISFVAQLSDLSDFGLDQEFRWVNERLAKLNVPYITVIGNHDMLANGRKIFREMFGAEDFSFDHYNSRFIFLNTNSQEVGFDGTLPNLKWLQEQLNSATQTKNVFIFSHTPPFSPAFDKKLELTFTSLLTSYSNVRFSAHAHEHRFQLTQPYPGHVTYVVAASLNKRSYVLVSVTGNQFQLKEVNF